MVKPITMAVTAATCNSNVAAIAASGEADLMPVTTTA
jgi:hypothetical protein